MELGEIPRLILCSDSDSDFYCFVLFTKVMTLAVFTEITSINKREKKYNNT